MRYFTKDVLNRIAHPLANLWAAGTHGDEITLSDLADHIQTIDRFSATLAQAMFEAGVRFRVVDLLARPLFRFVKGYLLRQGFRKGLPGFLVSVSTSYYVFMKYAKLWELERAKRG